MASSDRSSMPLRKPVSRTGPDGWTLLPLEPFGVLIEGDLSRPLSETAQALLVELVDTHGIVAARGQTLTLDQQRDLLRPLGRVPIERHVDVAPDDGALGRLALTYHSDFAFAPQPYKYLSLYGVDLDPGSVTRFVDAASAYDRLNDAQRARLGHLQATAICLDRCDDVAYYEFPQHVPQFTRPAILAHPRTGRPILYVNEAQTARLEPLARAESDAFRAELFALLYTPGTILEWQWSEGDLLIWDNLALQHGRPPTDEVRRRRLRRGAVADVDAEEMLPQMFAALG